MKNCSALNPKLARVPGQDEREAFFVAFKYPPKIQGTGFMPLLSHHFTSWVMACFGDPVASPKYPLADLCVEYYQKGHLSSFYPDTPQCGGGTWFVGLLVWLFVLSLFHFLYLSPELKRVF